eukprot:jgi/Astpho2/1669/e_gw1.00032.27.1_t
MQFKIEPFKHPVKMDPNYGEKTWKVLEDAIHEINNHNASGLSFEELYRNAYNMVINKFGERLYMGLENVIEQHLSTIARKIDAAQGESFLRELKLRWEHHNKSMQMIRDILMYMDRVYVKHQNKTPVHQLGLNKWRDVVVRDRRIKERLLKLLLEHVQRERTGELIDRNLMRSITQMLMDLGPAVYTEDFERSFLTQAAEFYQAEAQVFIASSDCPQYLLKAERRLSEEIARVQNYLDPTSEAKITRVVETELIGKQMRTLVEMDGSGMVPLLLADRNQDLKRMYELFRRTDASLELMRQVLGSHLKGMGAALVQGPELSKEPVEWVHRLLAEKDKYDRIISEAFSSDKLFQNVLNNSFEHFINLNQRSPEYISLFMDDRLRRGPKGMNEDETEDVLDKVMMLFRYLQEKDIFEKYYKQHLAKRLLSGKVVSDDAERAMLVKLKTECGYQFTSKLESMFNDVKTSRWAGTNLTEVSFAAVLQVLTTGSWPTQTAEMPDFPRECVAELDRFKQFYLGTHSGRKLTWQSNMGSADLKACFGEGGERRHELSVSTYHMMVLLLFNEEGQAHTAKTLQLATGIPAADFKRTMQSLALVKGKNVLRKEPMGKDINDTDVFRINEDFRSKLYKIKIGTVSASRESEPENLETRHKVEEDRKPQIEAAIVRIMKSRRVLDHNSIVAEVTRQLMPRFAPNPTVIKKRIESLIEREFLERDSSDRKLYRYLA